MIWALTCAGAILLILSVKKVSLKLSYMFNTIFLYAILEWIIYDLKHADPPYETIGLDGVVKTVMVLIYILMLIMCHQTLKIPYWINPEPKSLDRPPDKSSKD